MNQLRLNTRFIKVAGFRAVLFLWVILFGFTPYVQSQCTADAGRDTIICIENWDASGIYLGGTPVVSGGVPPYTYAWSALIEYSFGNITASDLLDDSTKANPEIVDFGFDSLTFYLTVTDSAGNKCTDSILIKLCHFYYGNPLWPDTIIEQGDSLTLNSANSFNPPGYCPELTFQYWDTDYNISDSTVLTPVVYPETTFVYVAVFESASGCVFYDRMLIEVYPLSIDDKLDKKVKIKLYPNPLKNKDAVVLMITTPANEEIENMGMSIYDLQGQCIKTIELKQETTILNLHDLASGLYVYVVKQNNTILKRSKLHIIN